MKCPLAIVVFLLVGRIECQNSISDVLTELNCTTLLQVLTDTGLIDTLEGLPQATLFAPTNQAIADAGELPDGDGLVDLLTFHAIDSSVQSSAIEDELKVASVNGAEIRFNIYNNGTVYTAQGAPIDLSNVDVQTTNGFIHVVNAVMFPPSETIYELVSNNPDFSTLKAAIDAAGIADIINSTDPLTVFAPSNEAFARVPSDVLDDLLGDPEALTDVLTSHAGADSYFSSGLNDGDTLPSVQGSDITIQITDERVFITSPEYAQVILPDVPVTNGVVHAIDRVLNLPVNDTNLDDISQTLADIDCTVLAQVLSTTMSDGESLIDILEASAEITLFAPTNEAIAAAGQLPGGEDLVALLTYHAVPAVVASSDIEDELKAASVIGAPIRFNIYNNNSVYTAQGAPIDLSNVDVQTTNGFIHVVNAVMFPPSETIYQLVSNNPDFSTLRAAIDAAGIADIINSTDPLTVFAPNNEAFARVPTDVLDDLLGDPEALTDVLTSHAVADSYFSSGLNDGDTLPSVQGSDITIQITDEGVFITSPEYAQVILPDVPVTNGVVHAIDRVLNLPVNDTNPDDISQTLADLDCTVLAQVLSTTMSGDESLMDILEGSAEITLFAPTNEAIAAAGELPGEDDLVSLLTYHAVPAVVASSAIEDELKAASVNGAPIRFNIYNDKSVYTAQGAPIDLSNVDVQTTNGFIHVVNAVMFPPSETIYELVSNNPDFSTLRAAIDVAGIVDTINSTDPLTVFAPNNEAFARVPTDVLDDLLENPEALTEVLTSHAVADSFFSSGLNDGDALPSVQGSDIAIQITDEGVFITSPEYAQVILRDVPVTNGVVHAVDRVLNLPVNDTNLEDISQTLADLDCSVLAQVLSTTNTSDGEILMDILEGSDEVTLFAPTNEAIAAAGELLGGEDLVALLTYHAVPSVVASSVIEDELNATSVNGAPIRFNIYNDNSVYTAQGAPIDLRYVDVETTNGFIHVVNAVMFPPSETIYQLVSNNPDFSTLLAAIDAAELGGILDGEGPLTVFAPNNAAFDNVPADVLEDLLADVDALTDVLLYHASEDTLFSAGLDNQEVIPTVQGDDIVLVINENGVFINSTDYAQVITTDVPVTNGVVHVINRVLRVAVKNDDNEGKTLSIQTSVIVTCLAFLLMILKL